MHNSKVAQSKFNNPGLTARPILVSWQNVSLFRDACMFIQQQLHSGLKSQGTFRVNKYIQKYIYILACN